MKTQKGPLQLEAEAAPPGKLRIAFLIHRSHRHTRDLREALKRFGGEWPTVTAVWPTDVMEFCLATTPTKRHFDLSAPLITYVQSAEYLPGVLHMACQTFADDAGHAMWLRLIDKKLDEEVVLPLIMKYVNKH